MSKLNWKIDVPKLRKEIGLDKSKLPLSLSVNAHERDIPMYRPFETDDGMPRRVKLAVTVYPSVAGPLQHRITVFCPECNKQVSAGRLHQHINTGNCK